MMPVNDVILLSHFISKNTPLYGGSGKNEIIQDKNILKGDSCNTFLIALSNHLGTHIDCPYHFNKIGKKVCEYKIDDFIFKNPALIEIKKNADEPITSKDIEGKKKKILGKDIILIKTGFEKFRSKDKYIFHNPFILPEVFELLRNEFKSVKAVGIDTISISNIQNRDIGRAAHKSALNCKPEILLVEDMKLSVLRKSCKLNAIIIAPVLIECIDSAPVTVIAKL